jgi:hypothetical protein
MICRREWEDIIKIAIGSIVCEDMNLINCLITDTSGGLL